MISISANAADAKRDRCAAKKIALTTRPKVMPAPHVLAVAVFEIQIKLVLAEKLEKMFAVGTVIAV